ncbi:MAG: ester cyclase [Deferribacteres bacterium]|nr:ester cyclase [candidate division KSB1 bacterium]MCB9503196.1 ester cyclase [Deferribacteres bacterium]
MSTNKQLIRDYLNAISGKPKTEAVLDKYTTDHELKEHIRFFESAFPKYKLIDEDLIEEGNKVAVRATFHGVHKGELMGIAATGKEVSVSLMLIYEIQDGIIHKHWMVADQFALMQQLGVIK